ncbi:TRAP transporter substrate-binding protein [Desulfobacula sp.]|uniref:TRAP transporter substrate-binding protein n=1 Tax=Desulfobacula sp. TaxID=2593537 RepID=UPI0026353AF2|nr:TRAP transporter substrate-binding protein [Desulfobacula sp.]
MKKMTGIIAGISVLCLICSQAWGADVIRMKFGHVAPPIHAQHKASEFFAKYVEKESNGRIKCSTHPRGQLGSHIQMLESLQVGTLEMVSVAGPAMTEFVPEIALTSLPYFYNSEDEMYALLDSPIGEKIAAAFSPKGLYMGGVADHGLKAFLNRKGPITKIEDMAKYKWRSIPNELFLDNYKAMGVKPITLPWPEVFSGLQRGVIDGIDITPNECYYAKIYEAVKYVSIAKMAVNPMIYVASKKWLESLPEDLRKIVIDGMDKAAKWHTATIREEDRTGVIPNLEKEGILINTISDKELSRFKDAQKDLYAKWRIKIGPELFDEAVAFLEKTRQ